ncbi:hypothetical protein EVAR_3759_1 [Eumeta japonica]|uniref:Uncharacterized protein n=1 Tax=Eumeta variegata TaxID=151549 RepID=A0A4C1SRR8_EUMVA|nr:hypothetical protein EVAR_3759_1 [Eumeta japonica]
MKPRFEPWAHTRTCTRSRVQRTPRLVHPSQLYSDRHIFSSAVIKKPRSLENAVHHLPATPQEIRSSKPVKNKCGLTRR